MRPEVTVRTVLLGLIAVAACKGDKPTESGDDWVPEQLGRCAAFDELRMPLFGDTHIHTRLSLDANLQGNRMSPADAYRFARGEEVGVHPHDEAGNSLRSVQLARPLDWAALSDHAEFMGLITVCTTPDTPGYDDPTCVRYRENPDASFLGLNILLAFEPDDVIDPPLCNVEGVDCESGHKAAWATVSDAAEAAYDRTDACAFTSFVGYEWSANPTSFNLHRNVIFRNERVPDLPIGYLDEPHVEGLWGALRDQCTGAAGGDLPAQGRLRVLDRQPRW
jgi:hypothetical protein